jgi:gliding motility-associated lipoprotein GldH
MRLAQFILFAFIIVFLTGCRDDLVYSKKIDIDGIWNYNDTLSFPIEIDQIDISYDLILSLTYGQDFGYQNIYVKINTQYPDGKKIEDVLSLNLTDGAGIFLGDCNSSICEIDILLQEKFKFKVQGDYEISIMQNGREENLENVFVAELKLFKSSGPAG